MSSIWDTVQKVQPRNYTHWPQPFAHLVDIEVLACEDTFLAKVKMWGQVGLNWFWTNLIPSPIEITRKLITGSYKCGFYLPIKVKSPLDIIWTDGRTSTALLEISSPVTKGLFALWAAQTLWSALDAYATVMLLQEMCDLTQDETLLKAGNAESRLPHDFGNVTFYEVIYDPHNRANPTTGFILTEDGPLTVFAAGTGGSLGLFIDSLDIFLYVGGVHVASQSLGAMGPGDTLSWSLDYTTSFHAGTAVAVQFDIHQHGTSLAVSYVLVTRFLVKSQHQPFNPGGGQLPLPNPRCFAPNQPLLQPEIISL